MRKVIWESTGESLKVEQEKSVLDTLEQLKDEGTKGMIAPDALYGFNMALKSLGLKIID